MAVYVSSKRKKRLLEISLKENDSKKAKYESSSPPSPPSPSRSPLPTASPTPLNNISDFELNKEKTPMKTPAKQKNTITSMLSAKRAEDGKRETRLAPPPTPPLTPLVQSKLLVGVESQTTCSLCGMSYSPILKSDVRSHENFHNRSLQGRHWPESYGTKIQTVSSSEYIVKVDASSRPTEKAAVQDIASLVNIELNAPPENPTWRTTPGQGAAFVYVKDKRATSLLIVERITKAHIMDSKTGQLGETTVPAVAGVSRIFTARNFRSQQMATRVLDASLSNFIYGISIPKSSVAWSQPTAAGMRLSLKWGQYDPSHKSILVYIED